MAPNTLLLRALAAFAAIAIACIAPRYFNSDLDKAAAWVALANEMRSPTMTREVDGARVDKKHCLAMAVSYRPDDYSSWFNLGTMLGPHETYPVTAKASRVPGGVSAVTKRQAFANALRAKPDHEPSWFFLGMELERSTGSHMVNGRRVTREDCFSEALAIKNGTLATWGFLGSALATGQTAVVRGERVGRRECFAKVVSIDPKHAIGWLNLATELNGGDDAVAVNGANYTQRDCLIMSLRSNPKGIAGTWFNLGMILPPGEGVHIVPDVPESYIANRVECFVRAVTINDKLAPLWFALAEAMDKTSTVSLFGHDWHPRDCYARAATLDRANGTIWARLVSAMPEDAAVTVAVLDGVRLNRTGVEKAMKNCAWVQE